MAKSKTPSPLTAQQYREIAARACMDAKSVRVLITDQEALSRARSTSVARIVQAANFLGLKLPPHQRLLEG